MKKIVSLLLTAMLFATMICVPVMAEDAVPVEILASESGVLTTDLSGFYSATWTAGTDSVWNVGDSSCKYGLLKSTGTGAVDEGTATTNQVENILFLKFVVDEDIESDEKVTLKLGSKSYESAPDVELVAQRILNNTWGTPCKNPDGSYTPGIEIATHCEPTSELLNETIDDATNYYYIIDVTSIVGRKGTYSIAVRNTTRNSVQIYTSGVGTSASKPRLIIEKASEAQTTSEASIENLPATKSGFISGETPTWYDYNNEDDDISVRAGNVNEKGQGLLKFTIPEVTGTVKSAKLSLTPRVTYNNACKLFIYKVDNSVWGNVVPTDYISLDGLEKIEISLEKATTNSSIEVDITDIIDEVGTTTLVLTSEVENSPYYLSFHSSTGARDTNNKYNRVDRQPSLTIEFTPDEFYYIQNETSKTASNVTRSIKLINNNNEGTPVSIIAQYDGSGKLVAQSVEKLTRDGWVESVAQNVAVDADAAETKIFLWRDLGNLIPIRAAE